jgi:hypothetical protein
VSKAEEIAQELLVALFGLVFALSVVVLAASSPLAALFAICSGIALKALQK